MKRKLYGKLKGRILNVKVKAVSLIFDRVVNSVWAPYKYSKRSAAR